MCNTPLDGGNRGGRSPLTFVGPRALWGCFHYEEPLCQELLSHGGISQPLEGGKRGCCLREL